jgi:4-amino-4-deoxy-L-arabinose transferase-like glycosyltransferase
LYAFAAPRWGIVSAVVTVAAWTLQPNLFGHGHYAAYDGVLTSLWALAIVAFASAVAPSDSTGPAILGRLATLAFGLVTGCALATKLTGWFLPLPFIIWAVLVRDRRALQVLMIGLPLSLVVLFLLMPPWWTEPVTGVLRFFQSNLTRGRTRPIPVQFLGVVYQTPNQSLPWYNTLVWTVLVTPVGFLLLAVAGVWRSISHRRAEPLGPLILAHWIFLLSLRALPHTPGHDGVRLFLPAFGVMALLVGMGASQSTNWFGSWSRILVVAAVVEAGISVLLLLPVPLSYYSPLVGGLPGAAGLGMEPTYYWDALSPEVRNWLRDHTFPAQTVRFATNPTSWLYLRQIRELPARLDSIDPGTPAWYVMQNRPGEFWPSDRLLTERSTPSFVIKKFSVPLIWVFPYSEYENVQTQLKRPGMGPN